jgi:hypothetical protein
VLRGLVNSTVSSRWPSGHRPLIGLSAGRALGCTLPRRRVVQFLLLAPVIVPGIA